LLLQKNKTTDHALFNTIKDIRNMHVSALLGEWLQQMLKTARARVQLKEGVISGPAHKEAQFEDFWGRMDSLVWSNS
jgi:hypothetical protein